MVGSLGTTPWRDESDRRNMVGWTIRNELKPNAISNITKGRVKPKGRSRINLLSQAVLTVEVPDLAELPAT